MNTQTLLLRHLEFVDEKAVFLLSTHLQAMNKKQLRMFLTFLGEKPAELDTELRAVLLQISLSSYRYAYILKTYLNR